MLTGKTKKASHQPAKSPPKSEMVMVALDVGTVNIKALIARLEADRVRVVGVGYSTQGLDDMQAGAIADIPAVVHNCGAALTEAEEQAGYQPTRAVLGIAGELIKGITNTTRVERSRPDQPLGMAELDSVIKATQKEAEVRAQAEIAPEVGRQRIDLKLINSALVGIVVDGYKVTNPIGFQGRNLEIQLYTAFAPLVHTGAIERVALDLGLELVAVAAEPFAIARSVTGDDQNLSLSAILIDIGGGTTDIAILREGGLEATRSFAIGGRSFTRAVMRSLGINYSQAEAFKLSFSTGKGPKLATGQRQEIRLALKKTLDVWVEGIKMSLGEFGWLEYLPSPILLSGGGSRLQMLPTVLKKPDWHKQLHFSRRPQIKSIAAEDIPGLVDPNKVIGDDTMITAIGLARVGQDTITSGNYLDSNQANIRRKVSQTLAR